MDFSTPHFLQVFIYLLSPPPKKNCSSDNLRMALVTAGILVSTEVIYETTAPKYGNQNFIS
jgi:hypothetical protein